MIAGCAACELSQKKKRDFNRIRSWVEVPFLLARRRDIKLHLYVLPAEGNGNPEGAKKAEKSFRHPAFDLQVTHKISGPQLYLVGAHYATWFGYIYDNEVISKSLMEALPILLNHERNDFYVFYKRIEEKGELKVFKSPRIFRSHVRLKKGLLVSTNPFARHEYILDGWVESQ